MKSDGHTLIVTVLWLHSRPNRAIKCPFAEYHQWCEINLLASKRVRLCFCSLLDEEHSIVRTHTITATHIHNNILSVTLRFFNAKVGDGDVDRMVMGRASYITLLWKDSPNVLIVYWATHTRARTQTNSYNWYTDFPHYRRHCSPVWGMIMKTPNCDYVQSYKDDDVDGWPKTE